MLDPERVLFFEAVSKNNLILTLELNGNLSMRYGKSIGMSEDARKKGNELFQAGRHDGPTHALILECYCKSVAFAPEASEQLLFAYMNRSAFLLHIHKYQDGIKDIDRALALCKDNELFKGKLFCRKLECLKKSKCPDCYKKTLKEIEHWTETIRNDDTKVYIKNLVGRVKKLPFENQKIKKVKNCKIGPANNQDSNILESVAIKSNEKYGRYLIAVKDFKPGDIIFTEKLFASVLNLAKMYRHCYYCFSISWSGIPCDHCTWALFCSESCKNQAWLEYHDIECSLMPNETNCLVIGAPPEMSNFMVIHHLCLRMLIIGIKKAGSIANLKAGLETLDELKDTPMKGFYNDGKPVDNPFLTIFTLKSKNNASNPMTDPKYSALLLIYLIRHSPFFEKSIDTVDELLKNDEAVFVGCLLIKLLDIKTVNQLGFGNPNPFYCEQSRSGGGCSEATCCIRGSCLSPFISLLNNSCFPNANRCFTAKREAMIYALHPIKRGSQIFISYTGEFYHLENFQRRMTHRLFDFICDCPACTSDWPTLWGQNLPAEERRQYNQVMQNYLSRKPFFACKRIFVSLFEEHNFNFGPNTLQKLSKTLTLAINHEQPSMLTCHATEALIAVFTNIYGPALQSYGQCEKKD